MSLKAKLEAIIYAAETPITLEHIFQLVKESVINDGAPDEAEAKSRVRATLDDLVADYNAADHGVEIRQVAGGYRMSTKPEHHDVVRMYAKSLKPPIRLSLPALETLAVIAYKQPVTVPEISEIRGVDSSGVIGTLLVGEWAVDVSRVAMALWRDGDHPARLSQGFHEWTNADITLKCAAGWTSHEDALVYGAGLA